MIAKKNSPPRSIDGDRIRLRGFSLLRAARKQRNLSQAGLGELLTPKLSGSAIWKLETGKQPISPAVALQLADLFDLRADELTDEPIVSKHREADDVLRESESFPLPEIDVEAVQYNLYLLTARVAGREVAVDISLETFGLIAKQVITAMEGDASMQNAPYAIHINRLSQSLRIALVGVLSVHPCKLNVEDELVKMQMRWFGNMSASLILALSIDPAEMQRMKDDDFSPTRH